jgi:hypothetical protein
MKVIRGIGKNRCERRIDFSRPLKYYNDPIVFYGKGFGIPVTENFDNCSEVYFWDHETIRATVGKDKYELDKDNPYVYEQLKNNVELLFALHGL